MAKSNKTAGWIWVLGVVVVVVACGVFFIGDGGDSTVPAPDAEDQQQLVTELERAAAAHNVCYGWELYDYGTAVNVGSNLGVGKDVAGDPERCPRWMKLRGTVYYTSDSSESEDSASYQVTAAGVDAPANVEQALDRLGIGTGELLEEPGEAIVQAARMLPLLALEGKAVATPVPAPSATGAPPPAARASNDFFRDRWVLLLVAGGLLVVGLGALLLGIRAARKRLTPMTPPATPDGPVGRTGGPSVHAKKR